ncbi:hypothetical protein GCM10007415_14130 [Parapedobacter pyrenivorans]|uniref:DUF3592 domain-containing protein n=1 Tax=Parapedobacter pyrenivorans TaxID=1305674 RepID=A0A917M6Q1_9SPHI|nr:DUF2933 domain-containing protein [Parapedobacter pyrenivorans]GGG82430.1 hypothetical protein GCM10007415_14130 [Parapedobacter pyrenivorans]
MGRKGFSVFWTLYALFFAVPFPMILYYPITYGGGGTRHVFTLSNPYWALAYLAGSVVLWGLLLVRYFRLWVIRPLQEERALQQLAREGVPRDAEVVSAKNIGKQVQGHPEVQLEVQFENISGTPIRESLPIVDMRPELGRFAVGQRVRLRLSRKLTKGPLIAFVDAEFERDHLRWWLALLGWLLLLGAIASYYVFSYHYEHQGTGWRFLTFFHPLLICPLVLLGMRWFMRGGLGKFFMGTGDALRLKYEGYRAEARLLGAEQTGTYINEQPQVRFELEYEDQQGKTHHASFKKVVNLLDMAVTRAETIPIFYLADQPQKVAFATDLDG